jgi:L-lactate utilization protein LutC
MTTSRERFLQRVRQAVADGNRAGTCPDLEARGAVGYQGAGPDLVAHFTEQLIAAGAHPHVVSNREAAVSTVLELARVAGARRILLGCGSFVDSLNLRDPLTAVGMAVTAVNSLTTNTSRQTFFAADLGISGVDALIAETGTVVVGARREEPRSLSLLVPVHIVVAECKQLLPDLFDLFETFVADSGNRVRRPLPSCLALITGPSKTGDIELRLVTGVHGPGEVHVILVSS